MNLCDNCNTEFTDTIMCDCEDKEYWELHDLRQEKQMKLNRRGKRVRAVVIYVLILTALFAITNAMGVWDVSESCLVEQVGCPDGYPRY